MPLSQGQSLPKCQFSWFVPESTAVLQAPWCPAIPSSQRFLLLQIPFSAPATLSSPALMPRSLLSLQPSGLGEAHPRLLLASVPGGWEASPALNDTVVGTVTTAWAQHLWPLCPGKLRRFNSGDKGAQDTRLEAQTFCYPNPPGLQPGSLSYP